MFIWKKQHLITKPIAAESEKKKKTHIGHNIKCKQGQQRGAAKGSFGAVWLSHRHSLPFRETILTWTAVFRPLLTLHSWRGAH